MSKWKTKKSSFFSSTENFLKYRKIRFPSRTKNDSESFFVISTIFVEGNEVENNAPWFFPICMSLVCQFYAPKSIKTRYFHLGWVRRLCDAYHERPIDLYRKFIANVFTGVRDRMRVGKRKERKKKNVKDCGYTRVVVSGSSHGFETLEVIHERRSPRVFLFDLMALLNFLSFLKLRVAAWFSYIFVHMETYINSHDCVSQLAISQSNSMSSFRLVRSS